MIANGFGGDGVLEVAAPSPFVVQQGRCSEAVLIAASGTGVTVGLIHKRFVIQPTDNNPYWFAFLAIRPADVHAR